MINNNNKSDDIDYNEYNNNDNLVMIITNVF